jgi:hypothetical protein
MAPNAEIETNPKVATEMFVIYDRGDHYELDQLFVTEVVARRVVARVASSIAEARSLLPRGVKLVSNEPRAEPHIAEIWV